MEQDMPLHVLFAYEDRPPELEHIFDRLGYTDPDGPPLVSNGEVYGLLHGDRPDLTVGVSDLPRLNLEVQQLNLADEPRFDSSPQERLEELLELVTAISEVAAPRPAFVYSLRNAMEADIRSFDHPAPVDADSLAEDRINHATWISIFPPPLVDTYGRQRLLDAPVWKAEELDDGAILVVTHDSIEKPVYQEEFNEYLDLDYIETH